MTRFIIFAGLLAVQFARGSEVVLKSYAGAGTDFRIKPTGEAYRCKLTTNIGEEFEYEPSTSVIHDRISGIDYGVTKTCSIRIRITQIEDAGSWKITAYPEKTGEDKKEEFDHRLYVLESSSIYPSSDINAYEQHYVYATLERAFPNISSCNVTDPEGRTIDVFGDNEDKDIELFGDCGFRMLANKSHEGEWLLSAVVNDSVIYYGNLHLTIWKEEEKPSELTVIRLKRGVKGKIALRDQASFCQLEDPRGVSLPLLFGQCTYEIPLVTSYHDGIWYARYGVEGRILPVERAFRVVTYEADPITVNVTSTDNGEIKLVCRVQSDQIQYYKFCRFIRPDGTILNMSPGVGDNRYSTYGNPTFTYTHKEMECGLVIREPTANDYGPWKCEVGLSLSKVYGSVVYVGRSNENVYATKPELFVFGENKVYVKRGDSFKVKCGANRRIDYCWLRGPNGTAYSVTEDKLTSEFVLPYEGSGFSFGECGATIINAGAGDHGEWECHVGIENGSEEKAVVSVVVTESYVIPRQTEIAVNGRGNSVLSCHVLPYLSDRTVDYCRWIRPDGHGIYNGMSHRYETESSDFHCELTILSTDFPEDFGRWTCVAGLRGSKREESMAHVYLSKTGFRFSALIAATIASVVMLTAVVGGLILCNLLKKRRRAQQPPAYTQEPYMPPKSLSPQYQSKEFQY